MVTEVSQKGFPRPACSTASKPNQTTLMPVQINLNGSANGCDWRISYCDGIAIFDDTMQDWDSDCDTRDQLQG
jgi:hypothetical protein